MFKKRVILSALILILTMAMIAGCGMSNKSANQLLQDAFLKSNEIKSASIDGVIELDLDLSSELQSLLGPEEQMILDTIKNAKISYKGSYQIDPMQYEITLSADIPFSGMSMKFDVPILVTADKMWIKIPSLPVPGMEQFANKFIELDFNQLAELSGEPSFNISESTEGYTKFSKEVTPIFFKHFEESYFNKVDVKTLTLANNTTAKDAVEFKITQDQLKPFITTAVEKVLPEMFDIMAKEEYQKLFNLTPEMVAEAKKELVVSPTELDELMTEMEKSLSNLIVSVVFAIDKNGFMPQQTVSISGTAKNPDEPGTVNFNLKMTANSSKINEPASFENSFPPANVIPFEELMSMGIGMMGDPYGDLDFDFDDLDMGDYDYETDIDMELALLYEELFAQPWFLANEESIDELYMNNEEFYIDLVDPEIIRALIDDAGYRTEFFAYYGVELVE